MGRKALQSTPEDRRAYERDYTFIPRQPAEPRTHYTVCGVFIVGAVVAALFLKLVDLL